MIYVAVIVFLLGLIIGSFLNVVIFRINTGKTFVTGRSKCMCCGRTLNWYELIPVFSFIFLGGRCKTCKAKISFQYPLVELLTGLSFVILFLTTINKFGISYLAFADFAFLSVIASLLIVALVYDIRHKIIPDSINFTFIAMSMVSIVWRYFTIPDFPTGETFLAGFALAAPFFLLWLLSRGRWMGFGDVKFAIGMGWLLGLSIGFMALLFAFWIGGIVGIIILILSKKYSLKSEIAFAPFLVIGTFIAGVWGITLEKFFTLWI